MRQILMIEGFPQGQETEGFYYKVGQGGVNEIESITLRIDGDPYECFRVKFKDKEVKIRATGVVRIEHAL